MIPRLRNKPYEEQLKEPASVGGRGGWGGGFHFHVFSFLSNRYYNSRVATRTAWKWTHRLPADMLCLTLLIQGSSIFIKRIIIWERCVLQVYVSTVHCRNEVIPFPLWVKGRQ